MRSMRPPSWFDGGWWVIVSPPMSTKSYAPPLLQTYSFPSGPSCAPFGPPPGSAIVSLLPSRSTRVIRCPWISQTAIEPSGSTTGPSGNSRPSASTRVSAIHLLLLVPDPGLDGSPGRAAAVHERGIERHRPRAVAADGDQAAVESGHDRRDSIRQRLVRVAHARRQLVRDRCADELLAGARTGDGHVLVRPGAGADHRRVADPALKLAAHAACRGRRCKGTIGSQRHRADRPRLARLLALGNEPARVLEVERRARRVANGALADQQHVRRLLHDPARQRNRMAHASGPGAGAGLPCGAVHDRG